MYDVIIIGAGASGSAIARELSRYQGKFCVLEKETDVCCGHPKRTVGSFMQDLMQKKAL